MLHRSLVSRALQGLLGLLFLTLSSVVLSGYLDVPAAVEEEISTAEPTWHTDPDAYLDAEPHRRRSLTVSEDGGRLEVTWSLETSADDPVASSVSAGHVIQQPFLLASEIAYVSVGRADETPTVVYAEIGPPTISSSSGVAHIEASAALDLNGAGAVVELRSGCADCVVEVEVRTGDLILIGISTQPDPEPLPGVATDEPSQEPGPVDTRDRSRSSATFPLVSFDPVSVSLAPPGATTDLTPERLIDLSRLEAWNSAWQRLCFALPWLMLLVVPLPRACGTVARRTIGLALAGLLLALFVTVSYDLEYPLLELSTWAVTTASGGAGYFIGSPGSSAATLLGVVWAGAALAHLARSPGLRTAVRVYLILVLLTGLAVVGLATGVLDVGSRTVVLTQQDLVFVAVWFGFAVLGSWLITRALALRMVPRPTRALVALAGAASVAAMAALSGAWSPTAAWGAGIATTAFDAVFLTTLIAVPVGALGAGADDSQEASPGRSRRGRGAVWALLFLLCVWIALPQEQYIGAPAPVNMTDVFRVADATVSTARVALFVALLVYLWVLSRQGWGTDGGRIRTLAWAAAAVMILRPDVLFGGLPVSFIAGVLLLRWAVVVPPPDVSPSGDDVVHRVAAAGRRFRLLRALEAALRQKVTAGETSLAEARTQYTAARDSGEALDGGVVLAAEPDDRQRAFGTGGPNPWRRGVIGAGVAAVAGLPGFLQAVAALSQAGDFEGAVPIISASSTLILVLRYPLYGFCFGYFFPAIRGDTGVAKSWSFGVVLGVSELLALLLPYQRDEEILGALVAWGAQIFLICFALGIAFDVLTLRRAGLSFEELLDVHHASRTVAFSSAVVASAATALVTSLASSAVTVIASRLGGG